MSKWIQKKEYPGGLVSIEWNFPRALFKLLGIGMLGLSVAIPYLPFLKENAQQILYCCSTPLFIASLPILATGFKNNK